MADYVSEEQQIEELKKWWRENWTSIFAGVVLGLGGLIGWRAWDSYHENQAKAASEYYDQLIVAASEQDAAKVIENTAVLTDSYSSTPYAALAALDLARLKAEKGELDEAAQRLLWIIDHSSQSTVRDVARLRLARVLIAQKKMYEALTLLSEVFPVSFSPLVDEARGDALLAKGEVDAAREAYDRALINTSEDSEYLKMKRDDLGEGAAGDVS